MINISQYDILKDHRSTLKELSKDTSNQAYMTESTYEAIDFDKVKTTYTNNFGLSEENAKSVDALAIIADKDVLIEFKNGNMKSKKRAVAIKIRDSLLILGDIVGYSISQTRENMNFILVYNKEKNTNSHNSQSKAIISEHIMKQANMEEIKFGLDKFKTLYFNEVHTYDENEFEEYLNQNTGKIPSIANML